MQITSGWWREVRWNTLRHDLPAGLLGALLALPQGIAFATLAGLPPQYGIFSAIVPCAVAATFGSSHHVVSGPTNANSLAIFAALTPLAATGSPEYIGLVLLTTLMIGVIQLVAGVFRLGWLTQFISPSVLTGFLSGAAALIALYAIPDLLSIEIADRHGPWSLVRGIVMQAPAANLGALTVAVTTLFATICAIRLSRRLPAMLIGLLAGYAASECGEALGIWSGVAKVGTISDAIPSFAIPAASFSNVQSLAGIAAALAIVALGQSISIARSIAQRSGQHLDVDRELVGQGLSNVAGSFFSSYLSCGSINRSVPNFTAGARTPIAAVSSALFLLLLVFVARPMLERLPMPAIAALLLYVGIGLFNISAFSRLARLSTVELGIALITFGGMFVLPFQYAILVGSGISLIGYLRRTAHPTVRWSMVPDPTSTRGALVPLEDLSPPVRACPQLAIIRVEGSIYFAATHFLASGLHRLRASGGQSRLLVLAEGMNFIDLAGAEVWEEELRLRRAAGGDLYFHHPRPAVRDVWTRTQFAERLGEDNIFRSKGEAIGKIYDVLDKKICSSCSARLFKECKRGNGALL